MINFATIHVVVKVFKWLVAHLKEEENESIFLFQFPWNTYKILRENCFDYQHKFITKNRFINEKSLTAVSQEEKIENFGI